MIVSIEDFKIRGLFQISTDRFTIDELQWYIQDNEKRYLDVLLGCELSGLFQADLVDGAPVTQRFLDIFNPICEDIGECESPIITRGIKDMLTCFIYFHYVRSQSVNNTITGNVVGQNELTRQQYNSELAGSLSIRWNRGAKTAQGIRDFIIKYQDIYPEYKGQKIESLGLGGAY